jgi:ABC-type transport system involved in multi-copper enzyme maturation permease subunit
MSLAANTEAQVGQPDHDQLDRALLLKQVSGIFRIELKKNLFSKRALGMYFLAFAPLFLALLRLVLATIGVGGREDFESPAEMSTVFSVFFEFYLRLSIFFSALLLFMNLFRSEVQERSLHYYLLTPLRRWVLVVGKYVSAMVAICGTFLVGTVLFYITLMLPGGFGPTSKYLFQGPGLGHLLTYMGIVVLACLGYGAIFLLIGLAVRNTIVPAAGIWLWEAVNLFLPATLKKLSIIYYLQSLYPIPVVRGSLAVLADPVPAWVSVPGLLLLSAAILLAACWKARRMEVSYGGD